MIGQEDVWKRLVEMVHEDRVPHAMMLCGPIGCGKLAMAMQMARFLLCHNHSDGDVPCGACPQCRMSETWEHPDLLMSFPVIKPAGSSGEFKPTSDDFIQEWKEMLSTSLYFDINQWLEKMKATTQQAIYFISESERLFKKLSLKSSQGGYKVCVLWLPERMRTDCANKMLKLLEEPPSKTIFIMVCQEPDNLLETIRSRVQRIDMKRLDTDTVKNALMTERGLDDNTAMRIARVAGGNWLKALQELADNNENSQFLDFFKLLMRLAYQRNVKDLSKWSETISTLGREKQRRFLEYTMRMLRENFMYNFRTPELCYMTQAEEEFASRFARFINEANIIPITELIQKAHRDIGQNANSKIVLFDMTLKMIVLLIQK